MIASEQTNSSHHLSMLRTLNYVSQSYFDCRFGNIQQKKINLINHSQDTCAPYWINTNWIMFGTEKRFTFGKSGNRKKLQKETFILKFKTTPPSGVL